MISIECLGKQILTTTILRNFLVEKEISFIDAPLLYMSD